MCEFFVSMDTSFLQKMDFDFNKEEFQSLAYLCQKHQVCFILSDIVLRETKEHIKENIENHINSSKKLVKKIKNYYIDRNINEKEVEEYLDGLDINQLTEKKVKDFLSATNCFTISSSGVKTEEVLSLYFKKEPPFSDKKKDEFKDAYVLLSCRDYMKDKNEDLYVISTDSDWKNFSLKNEKIKAFQDLNTVLDIINRKIHEQENMLKNLENSFCTTSTEFEKIKDSIMKLVLDEEAKISILFSASSYWGYQNVEAIDYYVEDLEFIKYDNNITFDLLNVKDDVITISCPVKLEFHIDGSTPLYYYDREDDEDMIMAHSTINTNINIENSIIIKLKSLENKFSVEKVSLSEKNFEIDLGCLEPDSDFYE